MDNDKNINSENGPQALKVSTIRNFGKNFPADFKIPRRTLGKTGEKLSVIGFGALMLNENPQEVCNELVSKSYDLGVNYYDVAPIYGNAEELLGPALKPYRNDCFLACKTSNRDAKRAQKDLDNSLRLLQTDHFDLYQLHAITSAKDMQKALVPGGAIEVIDKGKKDGKIKYAGFSAHSVEGALFAMENYDFDAVMFPVNFVCWNTGNFGPQIFEEAKKRGMGTLALKGMAMDRLAPGEKKIFLNTWYRPIMDDEIMEISLKYTLSKGVTSALPPGRNTMFLKALEIMNEFEPITTQETERLLKLAQKTEPIFAHD